MKYISPTVRETAYNCPHCGALANQFWHDCHAERREKGDPTPIIVSDDDGKDWSFADVENLESRELLQTLALRMKTGQPFFSNSRSSIYNASLVHNLSISQCFNCENIAIWVCDKLTYPQHGEAPAPNPDLPDEIARDYLEASTILDLSPRGSAALMRLAIQKLCKYLGQPGENINSDIKALVENGLNTNVQKALDVVRVIGNNAVHPGQLDLKDDRATAESLFRLLNLIVDKTISETKHVDEIYALLPESTIIAIEKRDKPNKK